MGLIAVLPAAGLGTRMQTVTHGAPKELLTVGGRPVLQWVIEESLGAGAERVVVVASPCKPEIERFLKSLSDSRIGCVLQPEPLGLADAVVRGLLPGCATLVPMPDYLFPTASPMPAMAQCFAEGAYGAVAVQTVPAEQVDQYGVVGFDAEGRVVQLIEKPAREAAPSRWAVAGRFALSVEASESMRTRPTAFANLTELLAAGLTQDRKVAAIRLKERAFDCGSPQGYFDAVAKLGN